jgi:small-conductance mechanosensitive channel
MMTIFSGEQFVTFLDSVLTWLSRDIFTSVNLVYSAMQIPAIVGTGFVAWWIHDFVYPVLEKKISQSLRTDYTRSALLTVASLIFPLMWVIGLALANLFAISLQWPHGFVFVTIHLVAAWIVVRLASIMVRDPIFSRLVAITAYTIATLSILDLLDPIMALFDRLAITLGDFRLSLLAVIEAMLALGVLLWLAVLVSRILERRIYALPNLTPSLQLLIGKIVKATFITIAVVIALSSVGFDITAIAVFSGGLGVGIGFGLQKLISNMISGIILLLDRSIKPGDVIQVGDTYGWVASLGARYVSIETRDGTEYLVPNEDIITHQVVSWSHQNDLTRIKIRVHVPFESHLDQALAVLVAAASRPPRVLRDPSPRALILDFTEGRAELELRFWIRDAHNGIRNISGEVRLEIWRLFRAAGILLSAPQRDVIISAVPGLPAAVPPPA